MKKLLKFPSIEQFRNVVKALQHQARYIGKDMAGVAQFDIAQRSPTLRFEGTIKLHGTNASIVLGADGEVWCQSRSNIITPEQDNAGFAMFVESNKLQFKELLTTARTTSGFHTGDIVIYGEWCGQGIQKGIALSLLPKMFVIFGIALMHEVDETYIRTNFTSEEVKEVCATVNKPTGKIPEGSFVYCIYDFPTFKEEIDFENPHEIVEQLNIITEAVGTECPVGKAFGVSDIGEGIVWKCTEVGYDSSQYWFKVKDDRHASSKVKTLATVDVERINNINELAERLANNGRLEQQHQIIFNTLNGGEVDIKRMGDFIKAVIVDVFKEDLDIIVESGFSGKDINGPISKLCRNFIMQKLEV